MIWDFIKFTVGDIWGLVRSRKIWTTVALIVWTYLVAWTFNHYYFQSPVKEWQCFMCSRDVNKVKVATVSAEINDKVVLTPVPVKNEYEIVMEQPHGEILWGIYQLESQRGKTDGCRKDGKFGGFGVMSQGQVMCYDTFEYAVERAEYWFAKLDPDKNLVGALCQWNTGSRGVINCSYYQDYLSL